MKLSCISFFYKLAAKCLWLLKSSQVQPTFSQEKQIFSWALNPVQIFMWIFVKDGILSDISRINTLLEFVNWSLSENLRQLCQSVSHMHGSLGVKRLYNPV